MTTVPQVDVVGVGLNATDTLIPLREFPARGSKVEFESASILPGGEVASAMVACQTWGLPARYVGKFGDDYAAQIHRTAFERAGVETHLFTAPGCPSYQSFILIDSTGERTVLRRHDDRLALQPAELQRDWITSARALLVDGHDTAAAFQAAKWARAAKIPVVADLDKLYPAIDTLLPEIDYLITSNNIPGLLSAESDLPKALQLIQKKFANKLTAATLGHDGVLAFDGSSFFYAPAFNVQVADTTGAGDIFHAAFIFALLQDWPTQRQLEFACAAAALNCTSVGARGHIAPIAEIERLIAACPHHPSIF
ncbi:MAG: carbohydrate kinase family protein [Acidobacteria bacterium]|nr:carbohydrate kinase family protein [Acidobacteriota bacterium]MBS1865227.1 carbohydrate kinase family protein [Acidobacteriota bacterium]